MNTGRIYDLRLSRYAAAIQYYQKALAIYRDMEDAGLKYRRSCWISVAVTVCSAISPEQMSPSGMRSKPSIRVS